MDLKGNELKLSKNSVL